MPEDTSTQSTKSPLYRMIIAIGGIVVALIAVLYFFMRGNNEGINIPADYETYETDTYKIGYPEDWNSDGEGENLTVSPITEDSADNTDDFSSILNLAVDTEAEDGEYKELEEGKCEDATDDLFQEEEGTGEVIEAREININGAKGCYVKIEANFLTEEVTSSIYAFAYDGKIYGITILGFNGDSEDFLELENAARTFEFKD